MRSNDIDWWNYISNTWLNVLCMSKKILFVETIAKQNELTITGKLFYLIANKFYVQSRHLAEMYRKAEFVGTLYKL